MNLSPRDRLIVTIALVTVLVIALIALLAYPQFRQLGTLDAQLADAVKQEQLAKSQLQQRQAFKDRAVEVNAKWLRLMNQVPDSPDLPSFIIELQDTAFKSGVQIVSVTPLQPAAEGGVSSVTVSLEILGSWSKTVDFMQDLMKLDRGIRLVSFDTRVTTNEGVAGRRNFEIPPYALDSQISLKAYMIPSGAAAAASGAKK